MADFGEIVDGTFALSPEQVDVRKYGFSPIKASGIPTVYHPGDVVNLPFASGEISSMEAIGLAWYAFSSGVVPE
jgi:hypothetical protein